MRDLLQPAAAVNPSQISLTRRGLLRGAAAATLALPCSAACSG